MADVRQIKEAQQNDPWVFGTEESIPPTLTVPSTWGTPTPASTPTVKVYSYVSGSYTDVTSTLIPSGSASISGQVITLPSLTAGTEDVLYRIEVKFTTSEGSTLEAHGWLLCKR